MTESDDLRLNLTSSARLHMLRYLESLATKDLLRYAKECGRMQRTALQIAE